MYLCKISGSESMTYHYEWKPDSLTILVLLRGTWVMKISKAVLYFI